MARAVGRRDVPMERAAAGAPRGRRAAPLDHSPRTDHGRLDRKGRPIMRTDNPTARWIIVLAGVMFLGTLAALVVLAVSDTSTATLERLAGPLLTAVIVTGVLWVTHAQ